jgi:hypothetical protein
MKRGACEWGRIGVPLAIQHDDERDETRNCREFLFTA